MLQDPSTVLGNKIRTLLKYMFYYVYPIYIMKQKNLTLNGCQINKIQYKKIWIKNFKTYLKGWEVIISIAKKSPT